MKETIIQHIFSRFIFCALLLFLGSPSWCFSQISDVDEESMQDGVVIIAHPSVPVSSLSRRALMDLYTLEINTWEDGSLVMLFDLKAETEAKQAFYSCLKQKPRELKKVWMRVVLSGEGRTPRIVASEEEIARKVAETPGALGYVRQSLVADDVKVLGIVRQGDIVQASESK